MNLVNKRHLQYFALVFTALMFLAAGFIYAKPVKYIGESSGVEVENSLVEQEFSKLKSAPVFFDYAIFSTTSIFNLISFTLIFAMLFSSNLFSQIAFNFSSRAPPFSN